MIVVIDTSQRAAVCGGVYVCDGLSFCSGVFIVAPRLGYAASNLDKAAVALGRQR